MGFSKGLFKDYKRIIKDYRVRKLIKKTGKLVDQKKYLEALKIYEKAIKIDPNNVNAWICKGTVLDILTKYQEALEVYEKAVVGPYICIEWRRRALRKLGKLDEALKFHKKALKLDSMYPMAWFDKCKTLYGLSEFDEALELDSGFEDALKVREDVLDRMNG